MNSRRLGKIILGNQQVTLLDDVVNYPTSYRRRATGTRVGVPSAGWHAPLEISQSGTIVANPRLGRNSLSLHKILDRLASD